MTLAEQVGDICREWGERYPLSPEWIQLTKDQLGQISLVGPFGRGGERGLFFSHNWVNYDTPDEDPRFETVFTHIEYLPGTEYWMKIRTGDRFGVGSDIGEIWR